MALQAGLRPDWRRLQQGLATERRRWPLMFSVGLRPEGRVKTGEIKNERFKRRGELKDRFTIFPSLS